MKVLGCLGSKLLLFTDLYRYSLVNRQTSIEKFSNTSWHKIHSYIWSAFIYFGGRGGKKSEFIWKASKQRRWQTRVLKNNLRKCWIWLLFQGKGKIKGLLMTTNIRMSARVQGEWWNFKFRLPSSHSEVPVNLFSQSSSPSAPFYVATSATRSSLWYVGGLLIPPPSDLSAFKFMFSGGFSDKKVLKFKIN